LAGGLNAYTYSPNPISWFAPLGLTPVTLTDESQLGAGLVRQNKLLTYQDKRYSYNGFGRLIEEHSQKNGRETRVKMSYDPLGRRINKTPRR
jgi:YD repeat-containing protein